MQSLCAFLNGSGGIVSIGVGPDGRLMGQDVSDATQQKIAAASPFFEERQGFLVVTFKAAIVEATERISLAPVTAPVTAPVLRLLELLFSKGNLGNAEILALLGLKNRRRMRETYIAPAMHAALIEYTIPDKPRSSKQKYRLTAMGREVLEKEGLQ